jgi:3-oxoadipate enol-lactonase
VSRPTAFLLHAFPLDSRMWDDLAARLDEAGYPVVAPDLPGEEPELGFDAWARRVLGLVDGPFVPVGSSMGGYLAFELWRQAPERIAALVLADTRATPDSPEQRVARDDSIRVLGEAGREAFWDDLVPKIFAEGADPAVVERARTIAFEQPLTGLVATQETIRDRADSRPTLSTIDAPVLVLVGEEDRLTPPADSEAMVAALPDARFSRIARAGHLAPLEQPEAVAAAVREFLQEVAP